MRRAAVAVLVGGFIGGALDITYAIVFSAFRGVPAQRILQSVASGLLGAAAYAGGVPIAVLGLVLHFCIAFVAAALFYLASRRQHFLTRHAIVAGALFGIGVYVVMNYVVLPLSAFPGKVTFQPLLTITGLLVHMFGFGVPIALATRRASGFTSLRHTAV
jgi:uncharacterized membrane protein YagU involved in acid resistance